VYKFEGTVPPKGRNTVSGSKLTCNTLQLQRITCEFGPNEMDFFLNGPKFAGLFPHTQEQSLSLSVVCLFDFGYIGRSGVICGLTLWSEVVYKRRAVAAQTARSRCKVLSIVRLLF